MCDIYRPDMMKIKRDIKFILIVELAILVVCTAELCDVNGAARGDDDVTIYLDGVGDGSYTSHPDYVTFTTVNTTRLVAAHVRNSGTTPCYLKLSIGDEFVTDTVHWRCVTSHMPGWNLVGFDDSDWPLALVESQNPAGNPVSAHAHVIYSNSADMFCRGNVPDVISCDAPPPEEESSGICSVTSGAAKGSSGVTVYLDGVSTGPPTLSPNYEIFPLPPGTRVVAGHVTCSSTCYFKLSLGDEFYTDGSRWRCSPTAPGGWELPGYDDSGWSLANAGSLNPSGNPVSSLARMISGPKPDLYCRGTAPTCPVTGNGTTYSDARTTNNYDVTTTTNGDVTTTTNDDVTTSTNDDVTTTTNDDVTTSTDDDVTATTDGGVKTATNDDGKTTTNNDVTTSTNDDVTTTTNGDVITTTNGDVTNGTEGYNSFTPDTKADTTSSEKAGHMTTISNDTGQMTSSEDIIGLMMSSPHSTGRFTSSLDDKNSMTLTSDDTGSIGSSLENDLSSIAATDIRMTPTSVGLSNSTSETQTVKTTSPQTTESRDTRTTDDVISQTNNIPTIMTEDEAVTFLRSQTNQSPSESEQASCACPEEEPVIVWRAHARVIRTGHYDVTRVTSLRADREECLAACRKADCCVFYHKEFSSVCTISMERLLDVDFRKKDGWKSYLIKCI